MPPSLCTPRAARTGYCPKSDDAVKSAVKSGCIVVGIGKAANPVADQLRTALGARARPGDGWEESRVNHLVLVVECMPTTGDCCEAANKFMRQVRASDGYGTYSQIIKRKVAILALGKAGKVSGASKVEDNMLKRGGCTRLVPIGRADVPVGDISALPWTRQVCDALDATMPTPPAPQPAAPLEAAPAACCAKPAADGHDAAPPATQTKEGTAVAGEAQPQRGALVAVAVAVVVACTLVFAARRSRK